jgi:hypothetical protein
MRAKAWGFFLVAAALVPIPARAQSAAWTPAAGGLDAVEATFDLDGGALVWRRCRQTPCTDPPKRIAIPIDRSRLDRASAKVVAVPIGEGRSVLHARVTDVQRKDLAFEALVAGHADAPIFAGLTGYTRGEEGDRAGDALLFYDRDDKSKFVLIAETREDTRICGQAITPLGARGLDAKTMQLRGATLHRLDKAIRDDAPKIVAAPLARGPLARLLVATGSSAPGAAALTDGSADTAWSEKRPGDGHGEFVTMRAPPEAPIVGFGLTIAPRTPRPEGAAPHTLFVATDSVVFHVTIPEDAWSKPGQSYGLSLPVPVRTTCVAVILDEAYGRVRDAPEVSLTEAFALTRFDTDGASIDDVAAALASARRDEAAAILKRAGDQGLAATAKQFAKLDAQGRQLAVDVAANAGSCEGPAIELLTDALADKEVEVKKSALGRLERCGRAAAPTLATIVRGSDERRRASAAPLLAAMAPAIAATALAEVLGKGSNETRRAVRSAFARAAPSAPRPMLLALLANREADPAARMDLLRSLGAKLSELRPESDAMIANVLRDAPEMPTRYLVAEPLAHLARSGDATEGELTRLGDLMRRDPEPAVRARAIELASGIGPLEPLVVEATRDAAPRVREAALRALPPSRAPLDVEVAALADPWTFVRVAAVDALAKHPRGQNGLARALEDRHPKVRATALAGLRSGAHVRAVRARLDDTQEDADVRAAAARTLGAMCARDATDRLTKLALLSRSPLDDADERIGMAAIEALSALKPGDLGQRLRPLLAKDVRAPVRRAVERALAEPGSCR